MYAPLHVHSFYSLMAGTSSIEHLLDRASALGLSHLALTDKGNLYGALPFYKGARERGIRPILGVEMTEGRERCVVLARDLEGYRNLCRIITRKNLGGEKFSLVAALGSLQAETFVLTDGIELARKLHGVLDRGRLWIEMVRPGRDINHERHLFDLARELSLGMVAGGDVYFCERGEFELNRVLTAIGRNALLADVREDTDPPHPDAVLAAVAEAEKLYADCPGLLKNTLRMAEQCNLELPIGRPIFPKYPLPEGETAFSFLAHRCFDALPRRYRPVTSEVLNRLTRELEVIEKVGFPEYFLIVADIVARAKEKGTPVVGRGSGASSLVAYLLGITGVDPIRYGIHFERFLNVSRSDCPDIDLDFCWILRDQVIESVYETYGRDRVAMISTYITFQPRLAFREVAKVLGVPVGTINEMGRRIPHDLYGPLREVVRADPASDFPLDEEPYATAVAFAEKLCGFPHHVSVHCGGIVIADRRMDSYAPLEMAAKGVVITQYDMRAVEDIGLVKIDLLGNHALTTLRQSAERVEQLRGEKVNLDAIPEDDPLTMDMIRRADTVSCSQLESPAMRNLLCMLRPRVAADVMRALALVRPGPASLGAKDRFVRRARGLEPIACPHPSLEPFLKDSLGIMLYEDDGMLAASVLGGLSLEEGDRLRKAIGKAKSKEALIALSKYFLEKAQKNGVDPRTAVQVWAEMAKFNSYSFCKAHAAGYAQIAYRSAYMKAHYPAEYMTAVLNHHWGLYPKRVHIDEARRMGIRILPPCVNESSPEFTLEKDGIRVGLGVVKELSRKLIGRITEARPFESLADFIEKTKPGFPEAETLILCGAFGFTGRSRPALIWDLNVRKRNGAFYTGPLKGEPQLKPYTAVQEAACEMELLGFTVAVHPVALVRNVSGNGFLSSKDLPKARGRNVCLLGVLDALRRVAARGNRIMVFATFEDEEGVFEATLFAPVYAKFGNLLRDLGPYAIEGKVEERYGTLAVNVERLRLKGPASAEYDSPPQTLIPEASNELRKNAG